MFRPGYLARKFVEGKRLLYLHPAQYYLFVSVVFFFILSFNVREYNATVDKVIKKGYEIEKSQDSLNINPIDSTVVADVIKPVLDDPKISSQQQHTTDSDSDEIGARGTSMTVPSKPPSKNV